MLNTSSLQKMTQILKNMKNPPMEEATTGDKEEYQRKRKEVAKKFGVESCSALKDETERKACYAALDAAHVSDDEEDEDEDPVGKNEEVELEENPYMIKVTKDFKYDGKVVTISKKDFKQVHKDFKNSTRGKERMLINDPKTGGSISVPVQFEEVEIDEANEFWAVIDKAKGGEVMAVSSDEKGAKSSVKMSNFSKHDYHFGKDPRTLKIVKVAGSYKKGEKMIGTKLSFKEEVEMDEAKGTAYPATIDTLRMIVKEKQHQTIMFKSGKAIVDLFTASAMVQVYDALKKPDMKKTFEKMITDKAGFMKTQAFAMKMVG